MSRPDWDTYLMAFASLAATRANCVRKSVGAVLTRDRIVLTTGYNGTPEGTRNCADGGCPRCAAEGEERAQLVDTCMCIHAEANALMFAARYGIKTHMAVLYTTLRPCIGCCKMLAQAGVFGVVYRENDPYPEPLETLYHAMSEEMALGMRELRA